MKPTHLSTSMGASKSVLLIAAWFVTFSAAGLKEEALRDINTWPQDRSFLPLLALCLRLGLAVPVLSYVFCLGFPFLLAGGLALDGLIGLWKVFRISGRCLFWLLAVGLRHVERLAELYAAARARYSPVLRELCKAAWARLSPLLRRLAEMCAVAWARVSPLLAEVCAVAWARVSPLLRKLAEICTASWAHLLEAAVKRGVPPLLAKAAGYFLLAAVPLLTTTLSRRWSWMYRAPLTMEVYHGTDRDSAEQIQAHGFRASGNGCLGAGVYFANIDKARKFARWRATQTGRPAALLRCQISVWSLKEVDGDYAYWQWWGYDSCYAPSTTRSTNPEWCVRDPRRQIKVLEVLVV